jgi:TolA-binding protein
MDRAFSLLQSRLRALALLAVLAVAGGWLTAAPGVADLQGRLDATRSREHALQSGIAADSASIQSYQGRLGDLQARLAAVQQSLSIQQAILTRLQDGLRRARARALALRIALARDRAALASQLRGEWEAPPPDLVNVVLDAHGFADLLDRADQLKRIQQRDVDTTVRVRNTRAAVTQQARRLAELESQQSRQIGAVVVQRDEIAQLRYQVLSRQIQFVRARNRKSAELASLHTREQALASQLAAAAQRVQQAQQQAFSGTGDVGPSGPPGAFSGHGGDWGFFPAPGTNYTVGQEPTLAARLDQLGKALQLHLIGISGYRSPQHSVEVGGFANDPHTRGEASDTPGVEGVPEATLERFGLTRPFPGPAEADHIQLF